MPKTRGGLWDEVVSFDNLYAAFREARKGHIYKPEVLSFQSNLEENLIKLDTHVSFNGPFPFHESQNRNIPCCFPVGRFCRIQDMSDSHVAPETQCQAHQAGIQKDVKKL